MAEFRSFSSYASELRRRKDSLEAGLRSAIIQEAEDTKKDAQKLLSGTAPKTTWLTSLLPINKRSGGLFNSILVRTAATYNSLSTSISFGVNYAVFVLNPTRPRGAAFFNEIINKSKPRLFDKVQKIIGSIFK